LNKARLIYRYLFYFVLVTKHGTYIGGFAGPQGVQENWAAQLVLPACGTELVQTSVRLSTDTRVVHESDRWSFRSSTEPNEVYLVATPRCSAKPLLIVEEAVSRRVRLGLEFKTVVG
jgi:hypothetical protein